MAEYIVAIIKGAITLLGGRAFFECLLFPKADIQITKNRVKLGAAFGHKRPFVSQGKSTRQ